MTRDFSRYDRLRTGLLVVVLVVWGVVLAYATGHAIGATDAVTPYGVLVGLGVVLAFVCGMFVISAVVYALTEHTPIEERVEEILRDD